MEDKYNRITKDEYLLEIDHLNNLLADFCKVETSFQFDKIQVNLNSLQDAIERVHKRKHYFKVFHNDMIASEYKETALFFQIQGFNQRGIDIDAGAILL